MGGFHPAGEHGQDGVPSGHHRWPAAPLGGGGAEVEFRFGGEGGDEQGLVLEVLAQAETVQRVQDLGAVPQFPEEGVRVVRQGGEGAFSG